MNSQFNYPAGVACDRTIGNLMVADLVNKQYPSISLVSFYSMTATQSLCWESGNLWAR